MQDWNYASRNVLSSFVAVKMEEMMCAHVVIMALFYRYILK